MIQSWSQHAPIESKECLRITRYVYERDMLVFQYENPIKGKAVVGS